MTGSGRTRLSECRGSNTEGTYLAWKNCSAADPQQQWDVDEQLRVIGARQAEGMCVGVKGGVEQAGQRIRLENCDYSDAQRWHLY